MMKFQADSKQKARENRTKRIAKMKNKSFHHVFNQKATK